MQPQKEEDLPNKFTIDINCDLGEECLIEDKPVEPLIMPLITSANIACGGHAGNEKSMRMCIELALENGAAIGAHPAYPDRKNFGRNRMLIKPVELERIIREQIEEIKILAEEYGTRLHHVKPHGALYNVAAIDLETALAIAKAVAETDKALIMYGLPGSKMEDAAMVFNLHFAAEAFPDRSYNADGTLLSRNLPGAMINDLDDFIQRSLMMVQKKNVVAITGETISLKADTLCVHGDNPAAVQLLTRLKEEFVRTGISVNQYTTRNA